MNYNAEHGDKISIEVQVLEAKKDWNYARKNSEEVIHFTLKTSDGYIFKWKADKKFQGVNLLLNAQKNNAFIKISGMYLSYFDATKYPILKSSTQYNSISHCRVKA